MTTPDPAKHAAYMRAWRAKNLERAREISRAGSAKYNAAHPERKAETARRYLERLRAADPEHREKQAAHVRAWRAANPERNAATAKRSNDRIAADPVARAEKNAKHRAWYAKHIAKNPDYLARKREAARRYAEADPERVRKQRRAANERYERKNPTARAEAAAILRRTRRDAVLAFFGGVCSRCGSTDRTVLQLDHINGGGYRERKAGAGTLREQYRLVTTDPDAARAKYQLLCANCNVSKR